MGWMGIRSGSQQSTSRTQRPGRFTLERLEDRRVMAADLRAAIPNLDFESYSQPPSSISNMQSANDTVNDWHSFGNGNYQLPTPDYFYDGEYLGEDVTAIGNISPPENGSSGFVGLAMDPTLYIPGHGNGYYEWIEVEPTSMLLANQTYTLDLFVGATAEGSDYGGAFEGEIVILGVSEENYPWIDYYRSTYNEPDAELADELFAREILVGASSWQALPNVTFTPSENIKALLIGGRTANSGSYLLVDAASVAPRVTQVTISGPNSLDGAYNVPDGDGDQIRTVPVGGADTVSITFNKDVNVDKGDLSVYGEHTSTSYNVAGAIFGYDPVTYTATWEFSAAFPKDQLVITLADSVDDDFNQPLDGEWTNPYALTDTGTSVFPSGDGYAGGDFEFFLTILPGDSSLDNAVGAADSATLSINWNPVATTKSFIQGDFNGDRAVGAADSALLYMNWDPVGAFKTWPSPSPLRASNSEGGDPQYKARINLDAAFARLAADADDFAWFSGIKRNIARGRVKV